MNKYNQVPNKFLINEFKKYCDKEKFTCLEIGCNAGKNLKAIYELYPNAEYYGSDIDRETIVEARENFPMGTFFLNDITQQTLHYDYHFSTFDYIILLDVLEHLTHPKATLEYIKKFLLKPEGKIFIGVPNLAHWSLMYNLLVCGRFVYTETGLLDYDHKHLFTYAEIERMLKETGFHINEAISIQLGQEPDEEFISQLVALSKGVISDLYYKTFSWHIICSVDN